MIQTIYYDISGLDLADEITLNVAYYNWGAKLSGNETREQCSVSYKVSFRITRFIGFSKSFVNTEGKLDNGVYLVPTHYTGLNKNPGMLDYFHPVYAYLVAENGHYTLVKPLSAYNSDILGNLSGDDFFNRTTGYCRDFAYFLTDQKNVVDIADDDPNYNSYYRPAMLNAKTWGSLTYEFHADTGAYYYTFDLGDSLTNDIILYGGSTGAMEQMFSFRSLTEGLRFRTTAWCGLRTGIIRPFRGIVSLIKSLPRFMRDRWRKTLPITTRRSIY